MKQYKERVIEALVNIIENKSKKETTPEEVSVLAGVAQVLLAYLPESSNA